MSVLKKIYNLLYWKDNPSLYWKLRQRALKRKFILTRAFYFISVEKMHRRFNAAIPLSVQFASMPQFPHGLNGILISNGARIGKNCVIFHQVTIGSNTVKGSNEGTPTIGDNVYIGAGAKIIGNVTVGNNVRIGANCVVVKSIPDNATVVLQESRIIHHEHMRDNTFFPYR